MAIKYIKLIYKVTALHLIFVVLVIDDEHNK